MPTPTPTQENSSDTSRRDFVKIGGAALAVAATQTAHSYAKIVGANDRVRVGVVGCGDRMRGGDIPAFLEFFEGSELSAGRGLRHLEDAARGRRGVHR